MAHKEQDNFINKIKEQIPQHFINQKVLGIGTFNVCGTEKDYFSQCDYSGLDLGPGDGVDIICPAQEYDAPDNTFDTIISCECFEHNPFWKETIDNSIRMLKPNGLLIFTCATEGRPVHGTTTSDAIDKLKYPNWKTMPNVSRDNWDNDYYMNLSISDFISVIDFDKYFTLYSFEIENNHHDLYFWGVKK